MHTSNSPLDEGILVRTLAWLALFIGVLACPAFSASGQVLFREDFNDLSAWKDVFFPKISQHTVYRTERSG